MTETAKRHALPQIGLGTGPLKGEEGAAKMAEAIRAGYRLLDTAALYRNEREVGEAVRASGVPREEITVVTKVWPDQHAPDALSRSLDNSLAALGMDHVDLFLLHWPNPDLPFADTVKALMAAQDDGRTREIGVSNFPVRFLEEIDPLANHRLIANQIEYHPYLDQSAIIADCRARGMAVIAHCPLGRARGLFEELAITQAAARHKKSPAQIVLRWHVEQDVIPIPGSTNPGRLADNLDVLDFALSPDEMAAISALSTHNTRICKPPIPYDWD